MKLDIAKILSELKAVMPEAAVKPLDDLMDINEADQKTGGPDGDQPPEGSPEEEANESPAEEQAEQDAGEGDSEDMPPPGKPSAPPFKKKFKV